MMRSRLLLLCAPLLVVATASADPGAKAKALAKEISLTDTETEKVAAIYQESVDRYQKLEQSAHGTPPAKQLNELRSATIDKIKGVLTTVELPRFTKLVKGKHGTSWAEGWSAIQL